MKLVDQWQALESDLPEGWGAVRLVVTTEQPGDLAKAAQVLGSLNAGRRGSELVIDLRHVGGAQGPEAARRLFGRLDESRTWCLLRNENVTVADTPADAAPEPAESLTTAASWDVQAALLPAGWSDALCQLELASSDHLARAALLCAPLNPTRTPDRLAFTFRCSGSLGYGASPGMARRCFERLDSEGITASVCVLRTVSDADNVDTQGTVWLVGGKAL